jgi:hypothetical protein
MKEAQAYAEHGVALVPIPLGTKGPVAPGWNEPGRVITDPAIAATLTGNIGIAHAYCNPRTAAIDVDDLEKATRYLADKGIDLNTLLVAPDTVIISSGRANRTKLLYRLQDDIPSFPSKVIKENGRTILELRCATSDHKTVQDVLPPSIHPDTGKPYQWSGNGTWTNLPPLPIAVVSLWESLASNPPAPPQILGELGPMPDYVKAISAKRKECDATTMAPSANNLASARGWLAAVPAACSYEQWRNAVWAVRDLLGEDGKEIARQWSATAPGKYNEASFELVWDSFKVGGGITWRTLPFLAGQSGVKSADGDGDPAHSSIVPDAPQWVSRFNDRFAVVRLGTSVLILDEYTPIETAAGVRFGPGYLDLHAFRQMHAGQYADMASTGAKAQPLANAWLSHPLRRQYQGAVFAPGTTTAPTILNLWSGFAVEPVDGDISLWLRVLCCVVPDRATRRYVLRWLARKVQRPGDVPGTILLMMGGKGSGKNSLFEPIVRIFGSHGRVFDDAEQIAGRFTGHLQTVAFAVLDEALFTGNSQQADRIKSRVTATSMTYEAKGRDPIQGVNRCAYVSLSNHAHVWQATVDERRAVVIEASDELVNDRTFWRQYYEWLDGPGPAALLYHLQTLDLGDFNPRVIPKGDALRRQVEQTALRDPATAWWHSVLTEGTISTRHDMVSVPLSEDTTTEVSKSHLHESFKAAAPRAQTGDWSSAMRKLKVWVGSAGISVRRPRNAATRGRTVILPPLSELRKTFEHTTGIHIEGDSDV